MGTHDRAVKSHVFAILLATSTLAGAAIDFEGYADGTVLTNQYPGVTFTNATIVAEGISLNEFDFPPHGGAKVIFDDGGPITVTFVTPVLSFAGYFTYVVPLTVNVYDDNSVLVASATTQWSNNTGTGGDQGSIANEFINLSVAGIKSVQIVGAGEGSSLTVDDIQFSSVPEPGTLCLVGFTVGLAFAHRFLKPRGRKVEKQILTLLCMAVATGCALRAAQAPAAGSFEPLDPGAPASLATLPIVNVQPAACEVGRSTVIRFVAELPRNAELIRESVELLRVHPISGDQTRITLMRDDGTQGDVAPNDYRFLGTFVCTETQATILGFRVSAAYKGRVTRVVANTVLLPVISAGSAEQMLQQLATQLDAGEVISAQSHFFDNERNAGFVQQMSPAGRNTYAAALRNSRLVEGDELIRRYELAFLDLNGMPTTVELTVARSANGEWTIN